MKSDCTVPEEIVTIVKRKEGIEGYRTSNPIKGWVGSLVIQKKGIKGGIKTLKEMKSSTRDYYVKWVR